MTYTQEVLLLLKSVQSIKHSELDQQELKGIYEREKVKDGSVFKHQLIEPTACPRCGNYRLDFGDKVYRCPQVRFCGDSWDDKLRIRLV